MLRDPRQSPRKLVVVPLLFLSVLADVGFPGAQAGVGEFFKVI